MTKTIANSDGKNQVPVRNELPRQTVDVAVAMAAKIGRRREPVGELPHQRAPVEPVGEHA